MAKAKKKELSLEEKLEQALVPANEQLYEVPENWCWTYLTSGFCECKDSFRKPINASGRAEREGDIPYYGATGQVGWIDDYLTDEQLVLVGEDGAPFLDTIKDKAYMIEGKAWVNNHAHILKSYYGEVGNKFILNYLNSFNYKGYVNGTTRLKLTQASMNTIPVPMPPLAEQKRIVEQIENLFAKLDEAKEKLEGTINGFQIRKVSILHNAFTGQLTKSWRENQGKLDTVYKKEELQNLTSVIGDGLHGTPCYDESGEYYFINGNNFAGKNIEIKADTKTVNTEEYEKHKKKLSAQNTVFVSINGTLGKTAFYNDEPIILGKSACYLNVLPELNKYYLRYYFETEEFTQYANEKATGSTIKNLGLKAMRELQINVPSIEEQEEIVRLLDKILYRENEAKEKAKEVLEQIDLIKKAILAKAFRGELGTNNPDEESVVELLKSILATE